MIFAEFRSLIDDIMAQGYDEDTASEYAALIGDTPNLDKDGRWLVIDESGKHLATIDPVY